MKMADRINKDAGTWKAEVYSEFEGLSISDLNNMAGLKRPLTDKEREADPAILK